MTALENIKNEFITNLLINQNKGVENIQKNLYSYEDYENMLGRNSKNKDDNFEL